MSLANATDWLRMITGGLVANHGFHHEGKGVFIRPDGIGWVRLRIDAAKSSVRDLYSCGIVIAIAHKEAVSHFSAALSSKGVLSKDPIGAATLCVNGHYLCPIKENPSYIYFTLEDVDSRGFALRLKEWIQGKIMPFIDRFSIPDMYWEKIEETNPRDWITADRKTTYGFQISYSIHRGEFDTARSIAHSFVEECSDVKKCYGHLLPTAMALQAYAESQ